MAMLNKNPKTPRVTGKAKKSTMSTYKKGGSTRMKKYGDGGPTEDTPSFKDVKKSAKQDQKLAKITAKTDRIKAGTEPSLYEKASTITGNVADAAGSAATIVKAVKDRTGGSGSGSGPGGMQRKGGSVKRMGRGGMMAPPKKAIGIPRAKDGGATTKAKKVVKAVIKASPEYKGYKALGATAKKVDDAIEKRYPNYTKKGSFYDGLKSTAKTLLGYKKTGGAKKSLPKAQYGIGSRTPSGQIVKTQQDADKIKAIQKGLSQRPVDVYSKPIVPKPVPTQKTGGTTKMQKGGSKTETLRGGASNLTKRTTYYGNGQKTVSLQRTTPQGTLITDSRNPLSSNNRMSGNSTDMKKMEAGFKKQAAVNKKAADMAKATRKAVEAKKMKMGGAKKK
jgi:hypothetical protein